jgi:predicted nucleotidyltransferase
MQDQEIQHIILSTLKPFNPIKIGVFGSFSRRENNADSDLDILVRFKSPVSLLELIRLENNLSEKLGIRVDLVTEGALTNPIVKKSVEQDMEIILET